MINVFTRKDVCSRDSVLSFNGIFGLLLFKNVFYVDEMTRAFYVSYNWRYNEKKINVTHIMDYVLPCADLKGGGGRGGGGRSPPEFGKL